LPATLSRQGSLQWLFPRYFLQIGIDLLKTKYGLWDIILSTSGARSELAKQVGTPALQSSIIENCARVVISCNHCGGVREIRGG
jgi:hypothetical protein